MRMKFCPVVSLSCLLLAFAGPAFAADQQTSTDPTAAFQTDPGYGARSLRGLNALHIEVIGESATASTETVQKSSDDPLRMLEDLLRSRVAKKPAPASLADDAKAALQSRTSIQLHEGSLDEARAKGIPILLITVRDGAADASGKSPFDVMLDLRQQVALKRDQKHAFYAMTYDAVASEPVGGRTKRVVLGSLMDRFIELWRAAN